MIFVKDKLYAKVWEVKASEKYFDLKISTSEKDPNDPNGRIYSKWFPRVIGKAFEKLNKAGLKDGDMIEITSCKLTNLPYKDKDGNTKLYFKFLILDADVSKPDGNATKETPKTVEEPKTIEEDEEDCPF